MSRLSAYKNTLTQWRLHENPFRATPPEDPEKLAQIFYGRDQALELAIPALYEGRNVLVRGAWGIGKTAFILNLIYQLQQEVAALDEKMLVLYLGSVAGETVADFYRTLLLAILDLFRQGEKRGFIMTGRGFTDLQEATLKALGIFSEDIPLETMSKEDLKQIVINYLNSAKENPDNSIFPFTEDVINIITTYSQGIPRQLNEICEKVLRQAASAGYEMINMDSFNAVWKTIQEDFVNSLRSSPHIRRLLYIACQSGGITEDIEDRYLDQLDAITFIELIPWLKIAETEGLLIRQDTTEGYRYLPSRFINPDLLPESQSE